jgi:hypothetical protein
MTNICPRCLEVSSGCCGKPWALPKEDVALLERILAHRLALGGPSGTPGRFSEETSELVALISKLKVGLE